MKESYKHLVGKLNSLKNKYYTFILIRGILLVMIIGIAYLLIIGIAESISYFSVFIKTIIFFSSVIVFITLLIWFLVVPLLKWIKILQPITNKGLAKIISSHYTEIKDKLLNVLELVENKNSSDLIHASINQKADQLNRFNFKKTIQFKHLMKRVYVLLILFIVYGVVNFSFSGVIFNGLLRLVHYQTFYSQPAPFSFQLLNDSLKVKRGENLNLKVQCQGKEVPSLLYIHIAGTDYLMNGEEDIFEYELEHVNNSFSFYFTDKNYQSVKHKIEVLPYPMILDFEVSVTPPFYTGLEKQLFENIGDLKVPFGTQIRWKFKTVDTDYIRLNFDGNIINADEDKVIYQVFKNQDYSIEIGNKFFTYDKLLQFNIEIIPDKYPIIKLVQLKDSVDYSRYFFKGSIEDDYGFHQLSFNMIINQKDTLFDIPIIKQLNEQDFYYTFNFKDAANQGETVHYYFEVSDNDILNGYKKTSSDAFEFAFPNKQELINFENDQFAEINNLMEKSSQLSIEIRQSIDELKYKSLGNNASNWEKQQLANEIVNKKNQLEDILNKVQQKNTEMNQMLNSFSEEKNEILKMQNEIQNLLEDVLNDELKELFDEFNKLAQDFNSKNFNELSEKYDLSLDDLSEQLERNLQVLKRMKVEQKMERIIDLLNELSDSELLNSQQLKNTRNFEGISEQELANEELFNNVAYEVKLIDELNFDLKKPISIPSFEKEMKEINSNYSEIYDLIENKRKNKAIENIEKNSKELKALATLMGNSLEQNRIKQNFENIQNLRQILDNLVYMSLEQERIYDILKFAVASNPIVNDVMVLQDKLIEQSQIVKDSLYALGKRTPAIDNIINKELVDMEYSMNKTLLNLNEENINQAVKTQQNTITSINNIAVFLNEALKNIEKQMANGMPGDQQCDKPGQSGKNGLDMLKQSQQSLKEQLQQMIGQMKSGQGKNMNRQLGQTLAQQEMMQQLIKQLMNSTEIGSSSKEQLKQIDQLIGQNKIDLMNKNITQQTINRQNLILDRLLKAEKAEIEREIDDQRESKTAEEHFFSNPAEFFEYKQKESNFDDHIQRNTYQLKKFYEEKYKYYINQLNMQD